MQPGLGSSIPAMVLGLVRLPDLVDVSVLPPKANPTASVAWMMLQKVPAELREDMTLMSERRRSNSRS